MKFIKSFYGVPAGEIYPVAYEKGDECPLELQEAAVAAGAVKKSASAAPDDSAVADVLLDADAS